MWTQKRHPAVIVSKFYYFWNLGLNSSVHAEFYWNLSMWTQKRHPAVIMPKYYYFWNLGLDLSVHAKFHVSLNRWTQKWHLAVIVPISRIIPIITSTWNHVFPCSPWFMLINYLCLSVSSVTWHWKSTGKVCSWIYVVEAVFVHY